MIYPEQLKSNRGMSIVEVLVVMAVLLIGIMSVVQMFPGGFQAVKHAESLTLADRLAQGELERWKNMAENLPWGVVPVDDTGVLNDQNPNPPITGAKATNIRRILRETTKIPVGIPFMQTATGIQQASIYTLAYAPIEYGAVGSTHELVITGGDLQRRYLDLDRDPDAWESLRYYQYGIDYDLQGTELYIYFRNFAEGQLYYISYSYWVQSSSGGAPELRSQADQAVVRVDDHTGKVDIRAADADIASGSVTLIEVEDGSDSVARGFMELAYAAPWNNSDPYQYKLVNDVLGIIAFNPYGYNALERTSRGVQPLEARISYSIRDLTIMRDDRRVGENRRIKLSLKYIMQLFDSIEEPEPFYGDHKYHGIWARTDLTGTMPQEDMVLIDLGSGIKLPLTDVDVNYEDGSITFPAGYMVVNNDTGEQFPIVGRNIRVLYKAEGDWSLQIQKAYELYMRDYASGQATYRTYSVGSPVVNGVEVIKLFFAPCEAGKTVAVDYAYTDINGFEHKVVGEAHQISDIETGGRCEITLDFNNPDKFGSGAENNKLARLYSVTGISFKVRVLWKEGSKWRYIDKDTTLLRKTTEV